MAEKIKSVFIFEILGRPPEHIKSGLEQFIDKLGEQKGINILRREVHEPKPLEDDSSKNLFTSFAEVELEADNLGLIFAVVVNMLPSHIEIIQPDCVSLSNFEISGILSDLTTKLHRYDEVAKAMVLRERKFAEKIKELQDKIAESEGKKNSEDKSEAKTEKKDRKRAKKTRKN